MLFPIRGSIGECQVSGPASLGGAGFRWPACRELVDHRGVHLEHGVTREFPEQAAAIGHRFIALQRHGPWLASPAGGCLDALAGSVSYRCSMQVVDDMPVGLVAADWSTGPSGGGVRANPGDLPGLWVSVPGYKPRLGGRGSAFVGSGTRW